MTRKLLATPPAADVLGALRTPYPVGDHPQDLVARLVAVVVVDPLEPVHVGEDDGQVGTVPARRADRLAQPLLEV